MNFRVWLFFFDDEWQQHIFMTQHDENGSEIFASLRSSQIMSGVITCWRMNKYAVSRGKRLEILGGFESLRSLQFHLCDQ